MSGYCNLQSFLRVKIHLQNRTHEKVTVEISRPDEPFAVKKLELEMKELDQTYFLTEQVRIKRKFPFFDSFASKSKRSDQDSVCSIANSSGPISQFEPTISDKSTNLSETMKLLED